MTRYFTDKLAKYAAFISGFTAYYTFTDSPVYFQRRAAAFAEVGVFDLFSAHLEAGIDQYGILAMIVGSIAVTVVSMIMAVPLGIACAILLAELPPEGTQRSALPWNCW